MSEKSTIARRTIVGSAGKVSGGATMEKLEKLRGQTPLRRAGQPAELGSIHVQFAAADASFATGQVYGSSGGSGQP
jgi:NAD(P)-dependent dehydrogenase (short-subunit alcohol dehydrogenase family)